MTNPYQNEMDDLRQNAQKVLAGFATEVVIHPRVALALIDMIEDADEERAEILAKVKELKKEVEILEDENASLTRQIEEGDAY